MKKVNKFIFENKDQTDHKLLNYLNMQLFLAVLQKDPEKVEILITQGADVNFQTPAKLLNEDLDFEISDNTKFLNISKYNHQIVTIKATNGDKKIKFEISNEETESIIAYASDDDLPCINVIYALIKAGANIRQTKNFDILKEFIKNGNEEFIC